MKPFFPKRQPRGRERQRPLIVYENPAFPGNFIVKIGGSSISGALSAVKRPRQFGGVFTAGEKIVRLHIDVPKHDALLLALQKLPEVFETLKKEGVAGAYGDISNTAVIGRIKELFPEIVDVRSPFLAGIGLKLNMLNYGITSGYKTKYLFTPSRRLILRFK